MKKTLMILTLSFFSFGSQASNYDEANWYLSIDVEQIKNTILPLMPQKESQGKNKISFKDNLPSELKKLTMYGHSEQEDDLTVIATGDFSTFSLNDYIVNLMYQVNGESPVSLQDTQTYQGTAINHFVVAEGRKNAEFYNAKLDNNHMIISLTEQEVKNWVDQRYSLSDIYQSDLVSLLVNVESAMAKMGTDLSKNSQPFNSAMFQKINQFSASMYEAASGDALSFEAALATSDEATAKQLQQVLNGLVAMNALSNMEENKPALSAMMSALTIDLQGSDLLISTSLAYSLIPQFDID
ncbi:MAG: hypothetical protein R3E90_06330 [Marinicella sp.]